MDLFEMIVNVNYSLGDLQDFRKKHGNKELEKLRKELYFLAYGIEYLQEGNTFFEPSKEELK